MGELTWPALIGHLIDRHDLTDAQAQWAMDEVMGGQVSPVHLSGFLVALRAKGETVTELGGLTASAFRHAQPMQAIRDAVDVVGTGGDRHHTVNISTMAAVVVAGTGTTVVKHGNRSASSATGSADVLERLGVRLDLPPQRLAEVAGEAGITFLFAQAFHPAFRHAGPTRRELGVPTAFNVIGPLTNPARPRATAFGVGYAPLAPVIAGVLADRGDQALVFRSEDGLDELATTAPAQVWSTGDGRVHAHRVDPAGQLGLPAATIADLRGGDAAHNAAIFREILDGRRGPIADVVALNAAAALVAAGAIRLGEQPVTDAPLVERLAAGLQMARAALEDGSAAAVLHRWIEVTNS